MAIGERIVPKWVPIVWEAFLDYRRDSVQLSRIEVEIVSAINSKDSARAREFAAQCGLLNRRKDGKLARNREREELEAKLLVLGLAPPWTSGAD
jgi:thymidylate synthase (FAD)